MTEAITAAGGRSGAEEILARILENAGQAGDRLLAAADEKTEKILADAAAPGGADPPENRGGLCREGGGGAPRGCFGGRVGDAPTGCCGRGGAYWTKR